LGEQPARDEDIDQLYRAAHDLNNLLATILNYAELLRDQSPEGQTRKDIEEIQRAAREAVGIARQVQDVARLRGGRA